MEEERLPGSLGDLEAGCARPGEISLVKCKLLKMPRLK